MTNGIRNINVNACMPFIYKVNDPTYLPNSVTLDINIDILTRFNLLEKDMLNLDRRKRNKQVITDDFVIYEDVLQNQVTKINNEKSYDNVLDVILNIYHIKERFTRFLYVSDEEFKDAHDIMKEYCSHSCIIIVKISDCIYELYRKKRDIVVNSWLYFWYDYDYDNYVIEKIGRVLVPATDIKII